MSLTFKMKLNLLMIFCCFQVALASFNSTINLRPHPAHSVYDLAISFNGPLDVFIPCTHDSREQYAMAVKEVARAVFVLVKLIVAVLLAEPTSLRFARANAGLVDGISPVKTFASPFSGSWPAIHSPHSGDASARPQDDGFAWFYESSLPVSLAINFTSVAPVAGPLNISGAENRHPLQLAKPTYPISRFWEHNPLQRDRLCGLENPALMQVSDVWPSQLDPIKCGLKKPTLFIDVDQFLEFAIRIRRLATMKPFLVKDFPRINVDMNLIVASPGPLHGNTFFDTGDFSDTEVLDTVPPHCFEFSRRVASAATVSALAIGFIVGIVVKGLKNGSIFTSVVDIGCSIWDTLAENIADVIGFLVSLQILPSTVSFLIALSHQQESCEIHPSSANSEEIATTVSRIAAVASPGAGRATVRAPSQTKTVDVSITPPCLFVGGRRHNRKVPKSKSSRPRRP
ncbi:hypothetical protein H0H81_012251 [Sphagnurus paluster]|uniref:Uncharacterized protein n=1 Tax=Sphagnurus paluster TaxID=117069 RepID=A0A9P7GV95_9AGAR|nr:hypothetical protein H0H81_012251 [Sphagnurus paluster]